MVMVAVRTPSPLGVNSTVNVVVAPAPMGVVGLAVIAKSAAFAPLMATKVGLSVRMRSAVPRFSMVKVAETAVSKMMLPKSVPSTTAGDVSPSTIDCPFP